MANTNKADDWRIEYVIVRIFGPSDFETVSFANPGKGFSNIKDAVEVLNKMRKASADVGSDPPAKFDLHVVTFHKEYGTFELELPGDDSGEDH